MREPDAIFADPRQAALYDVFDDDRSDLDAYAAIVAELGARRVIDVGCGTGTLAVRLAGEGLAVIGVDPAAASLDVARAKPGADLVTWIHGDATAAAEVRPPADLAVMTGNVAQVFLSDDDWCAATDAIHTALRPQGWFVFETRRPEVRDWLNWNIPPTRVALPDGRTAIVTRSVTDVSLPLVTFRGSTTIDDEVLWSTSTLRFRDRHEIERSLDGRGFDVIDVRDAPDRPGKEHVFLAQRREGERQQPVAELTQDALRVRYQPAAQSSGAGVHRVQLARCRIGIASRPAASHTSWSSARADSSHSSRSAGVIAIAMDVVARFAAR